MLVEIKYLRLVGKGRSGVVIAVVLTYGVVAEINE